MASRSALFPSQIKARNLLQFDVECFQELLQMSWEGSKSERPEHLQRSR